MPITTSLAACSTTVANNGPDGAVDAPSTLDDSIRYALAFIAQLRDTKSDGTYLQGASGAVTRTVQAKFQDTISVKDFGAVGDGVANDTAAIQAALNAAAGKYAVYIPAGRYNVTAGSLTSSGGFTRIIGEGVNTSRLQSSTGTGSILTITQTDFTQPITVSDLSFITYTQETQTGITINGNAVDAQINRVQARAELRNVEVRGDNVALHGPLNGIIINSCHNLLLSKIFVSGRNDGTGTRAGATKMQSGVQIIGSATGIPTDFEIQACYIFQGVYGFNLSGGMEGVNFVQCVSVACDYSYFSDQTTAGTRPWISFVGCHGAAFVRCISLTNVPQAFISNCLLYKRGEANSLTVAIFLNNCDLSAIHDNLIYNSATSFTTNGDFIGIAVGGTSTYCNVHHNKMDRVQYGVNLVGNASFTKTEANIVSTLYGSGTPQEYVNQSAGTGNTRLNNPRFENSQKNGAVITLNSATTTALSLISPDTAEVGDEFLISAMIHVTKDATAGGVKVYLAQTAGTGVPVFLNSFAQANGYCYLAASTDGYIQISTVMKIATAGPITLTLSASTNAGGATVAVNDAQVNLLRR